MGTDNCPGATTTSQISGLNSNSAFPIGTTTNVFTSTDGVGNSSTCAFDVIVSDNEVPTVTCPGNITVNAIPSTCDSMVTWNLPTPADNCGTPTLSTTHLPGSTFSSGTTTVTYTATDAAGNSATCSFTVTVNATPLTLVVDAPLLGCGYHVACADDSSATATLMPSGGCQPYAYLWGNGDTTQSRTSLPAGNYSYRVTDASGQSQLGIITITAPAPLALAFATDPACIGGNNGTVDLTATGGQDCAAYSYNWSNGSLTADLSGLIAGTYSVTVTDNLGCLIEDSIVVGIAPLPTPDLGADRSKCPATTLVLEADSQYVAFNWSQGSQTSTALITAPGTYWLQVTDTNGCQATDTIVIGEYVIDNNLITVVGNPTICIGDTVQLVTVGGLSGHQWNTGATTANLDVSGQGGNFWVSALDQQGCVVRDTASVNYHPFAQPSPVIVPGPVAYFCTGDSVTLDAGSGYFNYTWNTGAITSTIAVSTAGVYQVTVANGFGCTHASDVVFVSEGAPTPILSLNNGVLSTTQPFASYQWQLGGSPIAGATATTFTPTAPGWYSVIVNDGLGCAGESDSLFFNPLATADPNNALDGLTLYPNPTSGMVSLKALRPLYRAFDIEIWDMFGQLIQRQHLPQLLDEFPLDLTTVANGMYLVKIVTKESSVVLRVMVE